MEPNWTKSIPSKFICDVYYFFFVIYAIIAVLSLVGTVGIVFAAKLPKALAVSVGFQGVIGGSISAVLALYMYLICDRALLSRKEAFAEKKKEGYSSHSTQGFEDEEEKKEGFFSSAGFEDKKKEGFLGMW